MERRNNKNNFIINRNNIYFWRIFFRKKPSYIKSKIGEGYKTINLAKEKVIVAFRIEDINGNFLDIFPKIIYYQWP